MPTQHNSFSLGQISISSFSFEKNESLCLNERQIKISLKQGLGAEYIKVDGGAHVFLNVEIQATNIDEVLFSASARLDVPIFSENIDSAPLQNIVAILYSYLRPLIAQMTIFSKLPPLDLPPLNFSDLEVIERNEDEEQPAHEDSE